MSHNIRRYSETGDPKRPDYIVAENGRITETMLRHASYFRIPIVNIETKVYHERLKKRGEELLASISESDDYGELDKKIAELSSLSAYKYYYHDLTGIGRSLDIPRRINPSPTEERCLDAAKLEQKKRIDFIAETLKKAIAGARAATEKGEPVPGKLPGFEYFHISLQDVQNGTRRSVYGDSPDGHFRAPGNCNCINVDFRLAGSSRTVETGIYDGEHIFKPEEALALGHRTQEDIDHSDSSFYERIAPLAEAYFSACRENMAKTRE